MRATEAGLDEAVSVGVMASDHGGPYQRIVAINGRDAFHKCIHCLG
jgi:hypothetical protein